MANAPSAQPPADMPGLTARLASALRDVLAQHSCGQITCARALMVLHDYETDVEGRRRGELTRGPA